jgi:hypothetical protein
MAENVSLASVAEKGDRAATLTALRDRLAREIDQAEEPKDISALSARLTDVLAQLAAISPTKKVSTVDQLARKRRERRDGTTAG